MLRRDSELVIVPKFEVKVNSHEEEFLDMNNSTRHIIVDFEFQHPISKQTFFKA